MDPYRWRRGIGSSGGAGIERLGHAVLEDAATDLRRKHATPLERDNARAFFSMNNVWFRFWCECASVRPAAMLNALKLHGLLST